MARVPSIMASSEWLSFSNKPGYQREERAPWAKRVVMQGNKGARRLVAVAQRRYNEPCGPHPVDCLFHAKADLLGWFTAMQCVHLPKRCLQLWCLKAGGSPDNLLNG